MSADNTLELVIPGLTMANLREALFTPDECENFAVLLCSSVAMDTKTRLLVREWIAAPDEAYRERLSYHLEISPAFFNTIVDRANATGLNPVIVHSHPVTGAARYSSSDDYGERRLIPVLEQLLPGRIVASMLVTHSELCGRTLSRGRYSAIDRISVSGSSVVSYQMPDQLRPKDGPRPAERHDRQARAIGNVGQERIELLRVGVVGAGGTGSSVLEQLGRVGVNDIIVIDPDVVELSNLSRIYGSLPADAEVRRPKSELAARHLERIAPGITVRSIQGDITRQGVIATLRDRDVVFGCTDNHWSRAVINRFAHQYLVPVVDMGVRIDARHGTVIAAAGQITLVGAGLSCLRCSQVIDPDRVRAESLPARERSALAREGYVIGFDDPTPSVISLNTTVASLAVTAAIALFVNFTGGSPPSGMRYDARTGTMFTTAARHDAGCDICSPENGVVGLGDLQRVSAYD